MKIIYISSPYTIGDKEINVIRSMQTAHLLITLGFAPIVPLLFHYQNLLFPQNYETWISICKEIILKCDCLLRTFGYSKGADLEVDFAIKNGKPVFFNLEELQNAMQ